MSSSSRALSLRSVETSADPEHSATIGEAVAAIKIAEDIDARVASVETWGPLLRAMAETWYGPIFARDHEDRQALIDAAFPVDTAPVKAPVWPEGCMYPISCKNEEYRCPYMPEDGCPHARSE